MFSFSFVCSQNYHLVYYLVNICYFYYDTTTGYTGRGNSVHTFTKHKSVLAGDG